jgi:hypothetical protein
MKTSNNIRKNNISLASLALISILFMAGCGKDDVVIPQGKDQAKGIDIPRQIQPADQSASADQFDLFGLIQIDHSSARTSMPDYVVTVRSDASVVFEGRRNCAVNEIREFQASAVMMRKLILIYYESKFYSIEDNLSLAADLPMVTTTCSGAELKGSRSLIDYYGSDPAALIQFRTKVEEALDIAKLVGSKKVGIAKVGDAQL